MVSIVEGKLDSNCDSIDIIKATFPGGSITGCPKIRAMEIIDELEPNRRHVYTGSIGYMSFHDTMDLSIAIRTAVVYNDKMFVSVGGGIVYDSEASEEYAETLHKGKTLMNTMKQVEQVTGNELAWINGMIKPLDQEHIKATDLGFQYGYGFFETIRFAGEAPCYLNEHMRRFNIAWKEFFHTKNPDLSWDKIIDQVINANRLKNTVSSVKIIASWGSRNEPPYDHRIIVTARPYLRRSSYIDGLNLAIYPHPRQSPMADHKTLSYSYYFLAGKWAKEHGVDEALITNPDHSISETNTANITVIRGNRAIRPLSPHVLPGIMEEKASEQLSLWGYTLEKKTHQN
jgi:para-aminobenzoate synthetase component 1